MKKIFLILLTLITTLIINVSCKGYNDINLVLYTDSEDTVYMMYTVDYGKTAPEPKKEPSKNGYKFLGWYEDPECTIPYNFETPITAETKIYSKWEILTYKVSFVSNCDKSIEDQIVNYGQTIKEPEQIELSPCKVFDGWYSDENFRYKYNFETVVTYDFSLYAKWNTEHNEDSLSTTKEPNCTEAGLKSGICDKCNEEVSLIIKPSGHSFTSWFTSKAPSSTSEGTLKRICKVCFAEETTTIPATNDQD